MKHSELKVGMKVKRKPEYICNDSYIAASGSAVTVSEIIHDGNGDFYIEEGQHGSWNAEYFEPVEETKEIEMQEKAKISLDKKYKTRDGKPVRVLCVDRKDPHWPVVAVYNQSGFEGVSVCSHDGFCSTDSNLDLIEVSPYEDFKKDDKVMVRDFEGEEWLPRYFAYVGNDGLACTYTNGRTSWTAEDCHITSWSHCRKPTQEELGN